MDFAKVAEKFGYFLKLRGLSMTRERREILETIGDMKRSFTVDDLFFAMHAAERKTSKATLYRTIQLLLECRILRESDISGRQAAYELNEPGERRGVMVCEHCGKVMEFRGPALERFIREASAAQQFLPLDVSVKFTGFCNDCVRTNPPSLRQEVCVPFLKYAQERARREPESGAA